MSNAKPVLWLLVASLAVNVFLGATVGTHLLREPKGPPRPGQMLEDMAGALPPADAQILRQAMEVHREELRPEDDNPQQQHEKMRRILAADPFDLDAFKQFTSEFRARRDRVGETIGNVLADALPRMSREGRKRLADMPPPGPPPGPPPREPR